MHHGWTIVLDRSKRNVNLELFGAVSELGSLDCGYLALQRWQSRELVEADLDFKNKCAPPAR